MRYHIWRAHEDRDLYGIMEAGATPDEESELIWAFEANSWEEAKRLANDHISALRRRERDQSSQSGDKPTASAPAYASALRLNFRPTATAYIPSVFHVGFVT
jgi:hypothetical protein